MTSLGVVQFGETDGIAGGCTLPCEATGRGLAEAREVVPRSLIPFGPVKSSKAEQFSRLLSDPAKSNQGSEDNNNHSDNLIEHMYFLAPEQP